MKDGGCEKEAGRMKFTIETVEMKGHCSAGKKIQESGVKNSVGGKCFIVREPNEWRDGVRPILPAVWESVFLMFIFMKVSSSGFS
jgi:hypothetical protein